MSKAATVGATFCKIWRASAVGETFGKVWKASNVGAINLLEHVEGFNFWGSLL